MSIHHLTPIASLLLGLLLVFLGRKLFWIFVGVIGFVAGMHFTAEFAKGQPELVL